MRIAYAIAAGWALLALPGSASADTIPLRWTERASAYGHLSLTFTVDRLRIDRDGWSASLAIRNWDIVLSVHQHFALLVSEKAGATGGRALVATNVQPPLPRVLPVRDVWRGTIGGPGVPEKGMYIRLRLGTFRAVIAPNLFIRYVTRHSLHLA
jgi:hypothetical protein